MLCVVAVDVMDPDRSNDFCLVDSFFSIRVDDDDDDDDPLALSDVVAHSLVVVLVVLPLTGCFLWLALPTDDNVFDVDDEEILARFL